ncbi:MAG TPA: 2-amino-4-hydroxy-6-hydroxymethyldihydropteridine diphosphokinase [Bryobacteraceae bacterium]|jgi:2-amino-4-hydroxy-6-hydroxymethyldihydropteridine diphosphokinase|nr:2-amino-4-hydroxy-6-hydroxymethyldihydropteridine diphosphokinase [Bryobacteraceae bacterium]
MASKTVYLSLGSNIGNRAENLRRACDELEAEHVRIGKRSSLYETEPQDFADQRWFLNMAVECETRCFPMQLLARLQRIERKLGRVRPAGSVHGGPRTIDIDILLFGSAVIETPQLVIPHPRMLDRRFVLQPLVEIAPELRHPQTKELLSKYLSRVAGQKIRTADS